MKKVIQDYLKINGRKGGLTTKKKHGVGHYKTIGKKGGKAKKKIV